MPLNKVAPVGLAGGPAFHAYQNAVVALAANATQKIVMPAIEFDTNNCYSTANSRFTPNVAGYYLITISIRVQNVPNGEYAPWIFKNGVAHRSGPSYVASSVIFGMSALVYCNGTTDYIEAGYYAQAVANTLQGAQYTYFSGFLARPA